MTTAGPEAGIADQPVFLRAQITPLIITYNEAPNIARTIEKLLWARRIVVIDSGSTDGTLELLRRYPHVEIIPHPFSDFASQCNFGLAQIGTPWVLSLDADYELSDRLVQQLGALEPQDRVGGYRARFIYRIHGRPLRGSLYPPRTILYRREGAVYRNEGHGHRVEVAGSVLPLDGVVYHDDRKPLARWFASQQRYAREEAEHLLAAPAVSLQPADRLRRLAWPAPIAAFLYALAGQGLPARRLARLVLRAAAACRRDAGRPRTHRPPMPAPAPCGRWPMPQS